MSNTSFVLTDPQQVLEKNWDSAFEMTRPLADAERQRIAERMSQAITAAVEELLRQSRDNPISPDQIYEVARRLLREAEPQGSGK